jgi:predicted RNase H-like nuclease (RuvC/YqgF family)
MRKLLIPLALATASVTMAAPASAQPWHLQPQVAQQIRQDINELDRQILRAQQRRTISPREAASLRREAAQIRRNYQLYQRGGLTRTEVRDLQRQVNHLRMRLRLEQRDWDRWPGHHRR